jgi:hypothetical protein
MVKQPALIAISIGKLIKYIKTQKVNTMKILKRIVGILLVVLILGGFVITACIEHGTKQALLGLGIAFVGATVLVAGIYFFVESFFNS